MKVKFIVKWKCDEEVILERVVSVKNEKEIPGKARHIIDKLVPREIGWTRFLLHVQNILIEARNRKFKYTNYTKRKFVEI